MQNIQQLDALNSASDVVWAFIEELIGNLRDLDFVTETGGLLLQLIFDYLVVRLQLINDVKIDHSGQRVAIVHLQLGDADDLL